MVLKTCILTYIYEANLIQIDAPPKPKRLVRFVNGKAAGAKLKFVLLEGLRRLLQKILAELKLTGLGERM